MADIYRRRRMITLTISLVALSTVLVINNPSEQPSAQRSVSISQSKSTDLAIDSLDTLEIKGRAPKTDYTREQFGADWNTISGCSMRDIILSRDLSDVLVDEECNVVRGTLYDPYTGKVLSFVRGATTSGDVQIDHVVALSDAWQKGAQLLSREKRIELANDPLELLAVDGPANLEKSNGDAATWLPKNKAFRCQYVARQIAVKRKYDLWLTSAEYDAINQILQSCPSQSLPKA